MNEDILAGAGSDTTHVVDPTGREWYKLGAQLATGKSVAGTPNTSIQVHSNIQTHPNLAVGVVVYNSSKNTWSYITAFTGPMTADTTMVDGVDAHGDGDDFIFYAAPTMGGVWCPTLGLGAPCVAYNYAMPDIIEIAPAIPGLVPGVRCMVQGGDIGAPYDLNHPAVCIISPPPSVYHSGISTRLQVKSMSDWRLEYILRWKT
jgi:hypothetical protein